MSPTSSRPVDWEGLVQDNETRLYRAALAILGDPQEAEDVMLRGFTEEERARFAQYLARAYENFRAERGGDRPCTS